MEGSRRTMRQVLFPAAAAVLGLALCSVDHAANITYGVDLTVTFVQASKKGTGGVDPKIPAGVKSELFRAFGSKYEKYTFVSSAVRFAHMSKDEEFDTPNDGGKLVVRVTGYKQLWIMFVVTFNDKPTAFKLAHGYSYALKCGPDPDPLIVVITAKKVEVDN